VTSTEATIVGAAVGAAITVIGTLLIFFIQERIRLRGQWTSKIQNAIDELVYDKTMIKSARSSIDKAIEQLSIGQTGIYFSHSSKSIASISIMAAYSEGILLRRLSPESFANLNKNALVFFGDTTAPIETYVSGRIEEWKQGTYSQQDLYGTFTWIRETATDAIKDIDVVIKTLKSQKGGVSEWFRGSRKRP
jgi:hypothetical protein